MKLTLLRKKLLTHGLLQSPILGVFIRFTPAFLKYGKQYSATRRAIKRARISSKYVESWRSDALARVLDRASKTKWYSLGIGNKFLSVANNSPHVRLSTFETLKASEISDNPESFLVGELESFDFCSTSGSTGKPKIFYLEKTRGPTETAFVHDAWSQAGFRHTDLRAVFRGIPQSGDSQTLHIWRPALQELQISPFDLTEENLEVIWHEIYKRKITYLHGYPSALLVLARWILKKGYERSQALSICGLLSISEALLLDDRKVLQSAFRNSKIVSFYGMSEKVAFATQSAEDEEIFEFSPIYGITELLDGDFREITSPGDTGMLYSTGLLFDGTVFIRYETGDSAELVESPNRDNHYVLKVKNIISRWNSRPAIGRDGQEVSLAALNLHMPVMLYFSRMQYYQQRAGQLEIRIIPNQLSTEENLNKLQAQLQELVGDALQISIRQVDQLTQNTRGKTPLLVVDPDVA